MPPRRSLHSSGADEVGSSSDTLPSSSQTIQGDHLAENDVLQGLVEELPRPKTGARRGSKFQPKSNARRSQLEREAQEKAESERQKVRQSEASRHADVAERTRARDGRGRGRGRGDFRGGLSGWRNETLATGFLGGGVAAQKSSTASKRRTQNDPAEEEKEAGGDDDVTETTREQVGGSSLRETIQVTENSPMDANEMERKTAGTKKGKPRAKLTTTLSGTDADTNATSAIKKEEDADVTMLDAGPYDKKININIDQLAYVNLISEDEEDGTGNRQRSFNPVRINRKQHVERKPMIENAASSEVSEQVRKEAKAKGVSVSTIQAIASDDGVRLQAPEGIPEEKSAKRTGGRVKRMQGFGSKDVKQEEEVVLPIDAADPTRNTADPSTRIAVDIPDDDDPADLLPHKIKARRRHAPLFSKPLLQTEEDHAEWHRRQADMRAIAEEFSNDAPQDTFTRSGAARSSTRDCPDTTTRRDNKVYLFQLPPIMPNLCTPTELEAHRAAALAQDPDQMEASTTVRTESRPTKTTAQTRDQTGNSMQATAVKIEEDATASKQENSAAAPFTLALDAGMMPPRFKGHIGTLTIYENGSTDLDWGGISFEMDRGMGEMLQETLLVDREAGTASSMSQVAAGFIVKPSWDKLLESEE